MIIEIDGQPYQGRENKAMKNNNWCSFCGRTLWVSDDGCCDVCSARLGRGAKLVIRFPRELPAMSQEADRKAADCRRLGIAYPGM